MRERAGRILGKILRRGGSGGHSYTSADLPFGFPTPNRAQIVASLALAMVVFWQVATG